MPETPHRVVVRYRRYPGTGVHPHSIRRLPRPQIPRVFGTPALPAPSARSHRARDAGACREKAGYPASRETNIRSPSIFAR